MFSRKAALFVALILLAGLTALSLYTSAVQARQSHPAARVVLAVVAPLQDGVARVSRSFFRIWEQYFHLVDTARENRQMKEALALTRVDAALCRELSGENSRLRELLDFSSLSEFSFVAARVVAEGPSDWYKSVVINRGTRHGVREGMAVVTPQGVAGQVVNASGRYAQVLLLLDPNCGVDARVSRTRARGVVDGGVFGVCRMKYLDKRQDVRPGDLVVTTGLDRIFPRGLTLGAVTRVSRDDPGLFAEVEIQPAVLFDRLEEVLVVTGPREPPDGVTP
ncbi:MAG: rod shape-determining protein MreC [Pseudomonadota bacterium]